jgi:hypothetical protein
MKKNLKLFTTILFVILSFQIAAKTTVHAASPVGFIDAVTQVSDNTIKVSGWAEDPDDLNLPIRVHIYIDGTSGTPLGALTADLARSDVGEHGFEQTFTVPSTYIDGQPHAIYAFGIDNNGDPTSILNPTTGFAFQMVTSGQDTVDLTELNLPLLKSITVKTTYNNSNAIGLPAPNYEYSAHIIKETNSPYYKMIYGGRCYLDNNKKCQIPVNGSWPQPNGGGDGDHLKYAQSSDGIIWNAQELTPVVYQGQEESNPFVPEKQNRMDPTIIKWGNLYYMYYQLQIDASNGCTDATCDSFTDSITYVTSPDLKAWTKSNRLIVLNKPKTEAVVHPKAVKIGNEVWLYFGWIDTTGWKGIYLIKSTDPTNFDFSKKIGTTGDSGNIDGSQHALLFSNDPANRLQIVVGYRHGAGRARIPTLVFSHDGINWVMKTGNNNQVFPTALNNTFNIFCNIATDENSNLTPNPSQDNHYDSTYSCATFNGVSRDSSPGNVWDSDLSIGTISFTIINPADLNADGKVDIFDYNLLVGNFGKTGSNIVGDIDNNGKVDIFDYNILVGNFGK